ncbi:MAG: EFR1 family ferrodoxin [Gemmiger sp.]|nr:EFR1 family ferrodoxin [Gemmiger sp.]
MICYFSGTGNSQRAARQIAKACGDALFSINQSLRGGKAETLHTDSPLVFVTPTYGWRMPRVVEQWVEKTTFTGCRDAYFILTCGSECGNAAAYAEALCKRKGFVFGGLAEVVMPENYLALFPTPDKAEAARILAAAAPRIGALAEEIRAGKPLPQEKATLAGRLKSGPVNSLFYAAIISDKGFTVGDGCIGCGLCAGRCPLKNITLVNKRPHWNGSCTHCMACIGGCPVAAIEYKNSSKGRHRYYILEEEKP